MTLASIVSDNGNTLLLAILAYLAVEIRSDVREMRKQVTILWNWYQGNSGVSVPATAYQMREKK